MAVKSSIRALQTELKDLSKNPVEGFIVKLAEEENLFKWEVGIFGPPKTLYQGGFFRAILTFPDDYPYNPPSMKFISKMFHPNIYENGDVCISILHSPGEDPASGELASERWNPTQSVRTILLSVISMLNEPNINSAAYVDASVAFRKWRDSLGQEGDYAHIVENLVKQSQSDASRLGIEIPMTLEDYCNTAKTFGNLMSNLSSCNNNNNNNNNSLSKNAYSLSTSIENKMVTGVSCPLDDDSFVEPCDPDDDYYFNEDDEEECTDSDYNSKTSRPYITNSSSPTIHNTDRSPNDCAH